MRIFTTLEKGKPRTESITGLNLAAVSLTTARWLSCHFNTSYNVKAQSALQSLDWQKALYKVYIYVRYIVKHEDCQKISLLENDNWRRQDESWQTHPLTRKGTL